MKMEDMVSSRTVMEANYSDEDSVICHITSVERESCLVMWSQLVDGPCSNSVEVESGHQQ
jgi:hypothetical protein